MRDSPSAAPASDPPGPPPVALSIPPTLVEGRPAALGVHLTGEPGSQGTLRLRGEGGVHADLPLTLGDDGRADLSFRLVPVREGWHEWEADWLDQTARDGMWAAPGAPLRVLALSGPPSWEGRDLIRALEEGGAQVDARISLGRGLEVGDRTPLRESLREVDVVVLLPGRALSAEEAELLVQWVQGAGGGLILAGGGRLLEALGQPVRFTAEPETMDGEELRFPTFAELTPLPPLSERIRTLPLLGWESGVSELVHLGFSGRGRVVAVGLLESWRWRLEGEAAAHRAFWTDLALWAGSAGSAETHLLLADRRPVVGSPVPMRVDGPVPDRLEWGSEESEASWIPGGVEQALLVPLDSGVVRVLALDEAGESMGATYFRALEVPDVDDEGATSPDPARERISPLALLFAALVALALVEWTLRRLVVRNRTTPRPVESRS